MKRAALYVRVSTEEQKRHGISVDSQIDALRKYCADNNLFEVGVYNDAGYSARKKYLSRPTLVRLLNDVRNDKIDIIIFTKLDRWFRSVGDYYAVQDVLDEHNVHWKTIWEDYDTETPGGMLKVNIMLSVAQAEADNTSLRIKAVKEYQRNKGHYLGGPIPLGYTTKDHQIVIDEEKRDVIRGFFEVFMRTGNKITAVEYLRSHGIRSDKQRVSRMLVRNMYRGHYLDTVCEPYITPEEASIIDNIISGNKFTWESASLQYIFPGIIYCECGARMSSRPHHCRYFSKKLNKTVETKHASYICSSYKVRSGCDFKSIIFESTIEKYLLANVDRLLEDLRSSASVDESAPSNTAATLSKLNAKLGRLKTLFEDGDIDTEEYRSKRDSIKLDIAKIEQSQIEPQKLPELPPDWKEVYNDLDAGHKRAFWHRIIKKIIIHKDKSIDIVFLYTF